MKKFDIRKTFDIFLREPISVLTEGLFQLVNIENNIFSQKPYIGIDFVNKKTQITVVNSEKMYNIFQKVLFKQRLKEYSVHALEELFELMTNSINQDIRFKCATYILDRCYGKEFVAERMEEQSKDIKIQLVTRQGTEVDQALIDKEEQELWNEAIMEDDTDDWGTDDIYLG